MGIKRDYVDKMVDIISTIDPSIDKEIIKDHVIKLVKKSIKDIPVNLDNNVTGENHNSTLTEVCNWIRKRSPVVSGNATFYVQPKELESPTSNMLRTLIKSRDATKAAMFATNPDDYKYLKLDLDQMNSKVLMNAEYGGSGSVFSAFYTKYSPPATTMMARVIISIMASFFESFIGDNQKFFTINEFFDWALAVKDKNDIIPDWISVPSVEEAVTRIKLKFHQYSPNLDEILLNYIKNLNQQELVYLFYANNLKAFISRHPLIQEYIENILKKLPRYEVALDDIPNEFSNKFTTVRAYNEWISKEMFLNPYKIPESINDDMINFSNLVNQMCFVKYITPDSVVKLNLTKRNTVILVDTDSNIINSGMFVEFILKDIFNNSTFSRGKIYNEMIVVNILANTISYGIKTILDYYGIVNNMDEHARSQLRMKNEFMFKRIILMNTKKRYASTIALREGNIMAPFKTDIKGMDFIKSGVSTEVTNRLTSIIEECLLLPEEISLRKLNDELKLFERDIYHDLKSGGVKYLKPQTFKPEDAYKMVKVEGKEVTGAWRQPVFRAVSVWNELFPLDQIYSLDKVKILKLIVTGPQDLECIKDKYPKEYQLVIDKVFSSNQKEIVKAGFEILALPSTQLEIPKWLLPLLDYEAMISDNINSFRSVTDTLKFKTLNINTPNNKIKISSPLINF